MRTRSLSVALILFGVAGCSASPTDSLEIASGKTSDASRVDPASSPAATLRSARGQFEAASVVAPKDSACTIQPEGNADPKEVLHVRPESDGVVRFHALRPTATGATERLLLECTDPQGHATTSTIDLRSEETFAPHPFDGARANLEVRPALTGDPLAFTTEELIQRGYGLRPDPQADTERYARWLEAATMPLRLEKRAARPRARLQAGFGSSERVEQTVAPRSPPSAQPAIKAGQSNGTAYCSQSSASNGCLWTGAILSGSYVANANPSLRQGYVEAYATFTVPKPAPGGFGTGTGSMTAWSGLDNVFQSILVISATSTTASTAIGTQEHEQTAPGNAANAGITTSFTPGWNDSIFAEEWYCDASGNVNLTGGYGCTYMADTTAGRAFDCYQANGSSCSSYELATSDVVGYQAEFIVENDTPENGHTWSWPDFGQLTMTGCSAQLEKGGVVYASATPTPNQSNTDPNVELVLDPGAYPGASAALDHVTVTLPTTPGSVSWVVSQGDGTSYDIIGATNGTPARAASALDGYWGTNNSQHVNYIDASGHVHELYYPGSGSWVDSDLIAATGGTPAGSASALDAYLAADNGQHVDYIDASGHIHELYYPAVGPRWIDTDLNSLTGGTAAAAGSALDGYVGASASQHINYLDTSGHVHELYYTGTAWINTDLIAATGGAVAATGSALDAYLASDNSQHINYIDASGHIHELYHPAAGTSWVNTDLIASAGGTPAATGSRIDGYAGGDKSQHIDYVDTSGHVRELYYPAAGPKWINSDLIALANGGGAPAATGSALYGYWAADNTQHVGYIDGIGLVHELQFTPGGNWNDVDLTLWSIGTRSASPQSLDGYWGKDGSRHTNYIDASGHVREVYIP